MRSSHEGSAEYISTRTLARRIELAEGTVRSRRARGCDPFAAAAIKIGGSVRYHWPTVVAILEGSGGSK